MRFVEILWIKLKQIMNAVKFSILSTFLKCIRYLNSLPAVLNIITPESGRNVVIIIIIT